MVDSILNGSQQSTGIAHLPYGRQAVPATVMPLPMTLLSLFHADPSLRFPDNIVDDSAPALQHAACQEGDNRLHGTIAHPFAALPAGLARTSTQDENSAVG